MDVSKNIRAARTEKGITQVEIARQLGIERTNYHRLENRGNKLTIEQATAIAQALDMSLIELLTWGETDRRDELKETSPNESQNRTKELAPNLSIVQEYVENLKRKLQIVYGSFSKTINDVGAHAQLGTEHVEEEDELYIMYYRTFTSKELMQVYDIIYADNPILYYIFRDLFQSDVIDTSTREAKLFLKHYNLKLGARPH